VPPVQRLLHAVTHIQQLHVALALGPQRRQPLMDTVHNGQEGGRHVVQLHAAGGVNVSWQQRRQGGCGLVLCIITIIICTRTPVVACCRC